MSNEQKPLSSNSTQVHKANQRRETFAQLLRNMFQLDQPELDFGLYRIMHARKADINRFIEQDLPRITRNAFTSFASSDKIELQKELDKAIAGAQALDIDPETLPKVKQLQEQLNDSFDLAREEGEVYDALVTFFNRYYDEGDFLSRRVYKNGTYAIPYQGEEVVLHWANKDQYYIKSSETLRDYSFRLNTNSSANNPNPMRVHFKLVDAEAGAQNNNKESDSSKRVFILDTEQAFELIQGEANEDGQQFEELQLRFVFRAANLDDWNTSTAMQEALKNATAAAKKNPPAQAALLQGAVNYLLSDESGLPSLWRSQLSRDYTKADGNKADYSVLQGQLNNYTKKNSFDYFIHKDLGGFLTRELDFYIKNELLDWADISALKHNPARLAPMLSKIEVIRTLGENIIAFLAQLENFQKKLWLKKKFITDTQYCITLDRIAEHTSLLEQVFDNDAQLNDWANLYALDLKQLDKDYEKLDWADFLALPKYRYLMLDTKHFDSNFKAELLATIEDLDEHCDGLLVHSENFQALNLLHERYKEQVKCIYIDPPYNTGSDGFAYKDRYASSSWKTMYFDRSRLAFGLMGDLSVFFTSINEIERDSVNFVNREIFGDSNHLEEVVWARDTVSNNSPLYSKSHEYIEVFSKKRSALELNENVFREIRPGYNEVSEILTEFGKNFSTPDIIEDAVKKLFSDHKKKHIETENERGICRDDAVKSDPWKGLYPYVNVEYRDKGGKYVESDFSEANEAEPWLWRKVEPSMPSGKQSSTTKDPSHLNYRFYEPYVEELNRKFKAPKRGWAFPYEKQKGRPSFCQHLEDKRIWFGEGDVTPQQKYFIREVKTVVSTSVIRQYSDGEPQLEALFGVKGLIQNPKPPMLISKLINQSSFDNDIVLDYFGGSGTTAHATIHRNREDNGQRKYILVEMGDYFDTVLKPRIQKVVYSENWKSGAPISDAEGNFNGVSHCFKTIRLESYEDALGNLALHRDKGQQALLEAHENSDLDAARQSYVMNYMLEVETRGSASLLNTKLFTDPSAYQLNVRSASGDETKAVKVDLLETFNYLLGLTVEHIAAPIYFSADLSQGEFGRCQAKVTRKDVSGVSAAAAKSLWWFRTVYGVNRNGQKVLVVWRNLPSVLAAKKGSGDDSLLKDNAVLDAVLLDKLNIRLTASEDDEVDILYVNGDHNIAIPKNRRGELMEDARIQLIEEAFHRLMFANTESAMA
ncbi:MAG: site-specific DNA-methyltransferase [Thalassolituus sp.]|uniref:site-specific DNA-methyltransferase n=1 Tax=Thalassolituus sp. TaxID=2030822 RepID=UPI0039828A94